MKIRITSLESDCDSYFHKVEWHTKFKVFFYDLSNGQQHYSQIPGVRAGLEVEAYKIIIPDTNDIKAYLT